MRVAERFITFIVGFDCHFLNKLLSGPKIQIVCCLSRDLLGNLPPLGRHVLKGINCATESIGIGLSWFVFHFS